MTKFVLFEDYRFVDLLPLVYWRSVFELRRGVRFLLDRSAQCFLPDTYPGLWVRDWIAEVSIERSLFPVNQPIQAGTVLVNGRWFIDRHVQFQPPPFVGLIGDQVAYVACDSALSSRLSPTLMLDEAALADALTGVPRDGLEGAMIRYPWDLLADHAELLDSLWNDKDAGVAGEVDPAAILRKPDYIHIGRNSRIEAGAVIDASSGTVHIDENVVVRPHAVISGPVLIGPNATINPHAWIHGGTAIGSYCKVGGEINGCIFSSYSNKQHEGFLGHSYVGSWVNLGAGTVNSDLKNTYGTVRCPVNGRSVDTGTMFFGAVIGDHAKTGIGSRLPTGCSIGFAANAATSAMLPKFVPSFAWMTDEGTSRGRSESLSATAQTMMGRRGENLTDGERKLFEILPEIAVRYEK